MEEIELRSEEFQEILGKTPPWILRWGITVLALIVVLLAAGSMLFKYPDTVDGEALVTTRNPPLWQVARTGGKIRELRCRNGEKVAANQILAVIDNPAKTEDVLKIKSLVNRCIINDSTVIIPDTLLNSAFEAGNIQSAYSGFVSAATDYYNFLTLNAVEKEREALNLQIAGHRDYSAGLKKQLELMQREMAIAQKTYGREAQLFERGAISKADLETAESALLSAKQSLQQLQTGIASDRIESAQLQESLSKLDTQYKREKNSQQSALKAAFSALQAALADWEQAYLIVSPIAGTVTFNTFWADNQFVNAGERVMAVVPENQGEIIGRVQCPDAMSGKVRCGQRVNIRINGYPYLEYGSLEGRVVAVSLVANENIYSVEVALAQDLKTNTGQTLNFTGELSGTAEIVTDDRSLAARLLEPVRYLVKRHLE